MSEINKAKAVVEIDWFGGNCPVQAEGTVNGEPFYFRARGEHWRMEIGCTYRREEAWGDGPFAAGWMPEDEARRLIDLCAVEFAEAHRTRADLDKEIAALKAENERLSAELKQRHLDEMKRELDWKAENLALVAAKEKAEAENQRLRTGIAALIALFETGAAEYGESTEQWARGKGDGFFLASNRLRALLLTTQEGE